MDLGYQLIYIDECTMTIIFFEGCNLFLFVFETSSQFSILFLKLFLVELLLHLQSLANLLIYEGLKIYFKNSTLSMAWSR